MKLRRRALDHEIPLVPMANLTLLLLGFLLLNHTFAAMRGVDLGLPASERVLVPGRDAAVWISIAPTGALALDGSAIDARRVLETIAPKLAAAPETVVVVHPDPEAPYGAIVSLYDLLRRGAESGVPVRHVAISTGRAIDQFWD